MIYPAVIIKVISINGNVIKAQLDDKRVISIDILSKDKELKSLQDYLSNKARLATKKDTILKLVSELVFTEDEAFLKRIKEKESTGMDKKTAITALVEEILFQKNLVKPGSMIRIALAESNNGYNSKSIYVTEKDGVKSYGNSGIYNQAVLSNHIPIEMSYIYNREEEPIGYIKISTSNLINGSQIDFLLKHVFRTLKKETNKKPFLPSFSISKAETPFEIAAAEFNKLQIKNRKEGLDSEELSRCEVLLSEIMISVKKEYGSFKMELPLVLENKAFIKMIKENEKNKSPLQTLRNAIVDLNFSKENPDVKKKLKEGVLNAFMVPLMNAQYNPKLLTVYNIPAADLSDKSDSYGFMINNIDFAKLTLGISETKQINDYCEKLIL